MNRFLFPMIVASSASTLLLVDSAIKGAALLLFASLVVLMLRRDSAATRHLIWLVAIVAMLVVPALSALLPQWRVLPEWADLSTDMKALDAVAANGSDVIDGRDETHKTDMSQAANYSPATDLPEPEFQSSHAVPPLSIASDIQVAAKSEKSTTILWSSVLPFVWGVGFLLLVVRLLAARLLLWRIERAARIISPGEQRGVSPPSSLIPQEPAANVAGLQRIIDNLVAAKTRLTMHHRITLLIHPEKTIPVVWGIFCHRLLLPAVALRWSDEQLRSVLLHELAHIHRRDTLWQLLVQIACALHWFNPLVWFAEWRLHVERERACDDLVLASGVRASAYAEHLLNVATKLSSSPWIQACGLAMAHSSSLHGRLAAVLSAKRNRRSVSTFAVAICVLLGATILIPVAMLGAVDENQPGQAATQATEDSAKVTATSDEGSVMELPPGLGEHLDWSEPVNGLRAAVRIRTLDSPGIVGKERKIFVVIQNISDTPIRFCDTAIHETDVPAADVEGRKLYLENNGEIMFALQSAVSTRTDQVLQSRHMLSIDMFDSEKANERGHKAGDVMAEGIVKVPTESLFAVLNIVNAPEGAWTGKLKTPPTRGAFAAEGPMPTGKEGQALFRYCVDHARLNGEIPGGLVSRLHDMVQEFIRLNTGDQSGDSYAKKMQPLVTRFENKGDWKQGDVVTLIDDISAVTTIPLERTTEKIRESTLRRGQQLPASINDANWGEAFPKGLRMAWILEPRAGKYHVGSALKSRVVLHNSGNEPVMFVTRSFHQPGHTAKRTSGGSVNLESTFWTTRGRPEPYRLHPGEYCEVNAPGIGIGPKNNDDEGWANIRPGSWILANEGDDIVFQPGDVLLSGDHNGEVDPDWWLKFITERISRDAPLPDDPKEREVILFRVISDLFGNSPTPEEADAFLPDRSSEAVEHLATLLSARTWHTSVAGPIKCGETKFHVLSEDPDAATRPRVAMNPGRYTLGDEIRFVVTRRPDGERLINEADIIWYPPGKDHVPATVSLPNGYDTWAAGWAPGTTVLWVSQKELLRSYDFTDPAAVKEMRYEGEHAANAPIPAEVREALRVALETSDVPPEQPVVKPPAAAAPATNAVNEPAPSNPGRPPQEPATTQKKVGPDWKQDWNDHYSAVSAQTKEGAYFVLAYKGFISSGMSDSYSSTSGRWTFEGGVHLVDTEATQTAGRNVDKRVVSVKYASDDPTTLFLDEKAYKLSSKPGVTGDSEAPGRIFLLSDKGDPIQIRQTVVLSDEKALERIAEIVEQKLQQDQQVVQQPAVDKLVRQWQRYARSDGRLPGALLGTVRRQIENFVKQYPAEEATPKLAAMLPLFDVTHDWTPNDVVKLLAEVATIHAAPLGWADLPLEFSEMRRMRNGTPLPAALLNVAWGTPAENGLRTAWVLDPQNDEYHLGTVLKSRLLFHNDGDEPIVFMTETWRQDDRHQAYDADSKDIKVGGTWFSGVTPMATCRLAPGDHVEFNGHGIGIGPGTYAEELSTGSVGAWIEAKAGDEVRFVTTVNIRSEGWTRPDDPKDPDALRQASIAERIAMESPLPVSEADRKLLLTHVIADIFGETPTDGEITAFSSDHSPDALLNLTVHLQQRVHSPLFVGSMQTGEVTFRVLPVDPAAATKPRRAISPGRYVLSDSVQLAVQQITTSERFGGSEIRTNNAKIIFLSPDPKVESPHPPFEIKLPDGNANYAILWTRNSGELLVVEFGGVRTINYSDPTNITESQAKENLSPEWKQLLPVGLKPDEAKNAP